MRGLNSYNKMSRGRQTKKVYLNFSFLFALYSIIVMILTINKVGRNQKNLMDGEIYRA